MDQLAEELLCRIIKEVGWGPFIRQLPLVNRKFARIAIPMVYERIRASYRYHKRQQAARRLLDTLITSPCLRSLCHRLDLYDWQTIHQPEKLPDIAPISLADLSNVVPQVPALTSFPLDWQRKFGANLLQSAPDAMLASTLLLLPNLYRFVIPVNQRYPKHARDLERTDFTPLDFNQTLTMRLIELSTTQSLRPFSLFSRLTNIWIRDDGEDKSPGWDTNLISFCLRLPTLKKFSGHGCRDMEEDGERSSTWVCGYEASHVTSIDLGNCRIGADSIRRILRSCKALEEFRLARVCKECWARHESHRYSYAHVHPYLDRHKESLRLLRLQSQYCLHSSSRDGEPIKTLAALNNLQTLEIDEDALFGSCDEASRPLTELLPSQLQDITIYGEDERDKHSIFREVGLALLSSTNFSAVRFEFACIADAEDILKELPDVGLIELSERNNDYCDFRMDRIVAESGT